MIATGSSEDNQKATGYKRYKNIMIMGGVWKNSKKINPARSDFAADLTLH